MNDGKPEIQLAGINIHIILLRHKSPWWCLILVAHDSNYDEPCSRQPRTYSTTTNTNNIIWYIKVLVTDEANEFASIYTHVHIWTHMKEFYEIYMSV